MSDPSHQTVTVTLTDEATGETLAVSSVPVAQLPDTFALDTSLQIGGSRYAVVRAEPPTKAQFASEKRLTLFLRKVEAVDPKDILFSLPTICGAALPESAPGKPAGAVAVLHEDDWRQCEFVALDHAQAISAELDAIQQIYATASAEAGWRKLHVRERIPHPLPRGLAWRAVTAHLGPHHALGGVAFGDDRRPVKGAVAVTLRNGAILWGIEAAGELTVLSLQNGAGASPSTVAALKRVADELSLFLVDWCRCRVHCPPGRTLDGMLGGPWDEVH
jgi:hypothetical protein